jgi:hypothetical protein
VSGGSLDKVLAAAGGGGRYLPESGENGAPDQEYHDHLSKECPWYARVSSGQAGDPEQHCKPAKHTGAVPRLVVKGTDELLEFDQVFLTPRTPEASTVVQPTVPPGGPGLFHMKGHHLPPYVEHLYKHLVGRYGKQKAYGVAIGVVKKWAAGINPGGKHPTHTHADVRAAAAKNVAEWEKEKAEAHSGSRSDHALAATMELAGFPGQPGFPGQEEIPLGVPPPGKTSVAMFTAHRLDDSLRHLAHTSERLVAAKKDKVLRRYHMSHVNNHLSHALENGHMLVDHIKANYPMEGHELEQLNQTMMLARSVSPACKQATFAHLLQTMIYHEGHAKRHALQMLKTDPEDEWEFNYDHAAKHNKEGLEHLFKLAHHIRDNYPLEAKYYKELERAEDPEDPYTGLTAGPTETKAQVHYRATDSETRRCGTCSMFRDGTCTLVRGSIAPGSVCDEWEKGKQVKLAATKVTAPGAMYDVVAPDATSKFSTYGLHQRPSQTVSPSPPLPPKVPLPTPAEIRKLIPQVPECQDPMYTRQVRVFLEDAAVKMERDHVLDSLHALRSASHAIIPAHKADLALAMPAVYTAAVFAKIPPAAQSSATSEMKQSRERTNEWRSLQKKTLALADRIRKNFFHGVYNGPSQMARLTEAEVSARDKVMAMADTTSALDKVLAMAAVTGQDVSFPTTSDTSQKTEEHGASSSGDINISDDARKELAGLPATDKVCINAYIEGAQRAAGVADHYLSRQYLARAHAAAVRAHAHELTKCLVACIRAMQPGMQPTHGFGGPGHGGADNTEAPSGNSGKY